ncbi:ureidoglycolate lyase [Paracidovorax sp. MALMAid1276]|uniref:ureidoglycolate lyase n=1 Tax=Paracidovorax sp. MALMAid1276 TaxID=3411631 RepID=UPI003B9B0D56
MNMSNAPQSSSAILVPVPLTPEAFAPFGAVLQAPSPVGLGGGNDRGDTRESGLSRVAAEARAAAQTGAGRAINGGTAERFDLVDDLQLGARGGRAQLAVFRAQARRFPLELQALERHQWGSQTFVPWGRGRFVAVVAAAGPAPQADALHAFVTDGHQGIVLWPGTWHHALVAVDAGDFLVIERAGPEADCDIHTLPAPVLLPRSFLPP